MKLLAWWREGTRSMFFLRPRIDGLHAGPAEVALLVLLPWAGMFGVDRLGVDGPAWFDWASLLYGWFAIAALAFACWCARPARGAARLFALLSAQGPAQLLAWTAATLWLEIGAVAVLAWVLAAMVWPLWRLGDGGGRAPAVVIALAGACLPLFVGEDLQAWFPQEPEAHAEPRLRLSQELIELQPRLLAQRLDTLARGTPGRTEVYALTYAPYASDGVFRRESALVESLMAERFGAAGRTVQLVNDPTTAAQLPWATPLNLRRAIDAAAARMNRDEDVLFIHLTSHGAQSGELASSFAPLEVDALTPAQLKAWLDAAGVRHRVISVSACYSGSWIAPLAGDDTLVMTAADAEHTSYGCGRLSELTFFGRAMYAEALRETRSFEEAHARAREVIRRREEEAGKDDGYSNPQISVGTRIRAKLAQLEH